MICSEEYGCSSTIANQYRLPGNVDRGRNKWRTCHFYFSCSISRSQVNAQVELRDQHETSTYVLQVRDGDRPAFSAFLIPSLNTRMSPFEPTTRAVSDDPNPLTLRLASC